MSKPSVKVSPLKKLLSEFVSEPTAPPIVKAKDNYPRSIPITEYADENAVRKFPLPSVNYDTSKGLNTEELNFWALFCKSFFSSWEYLYETSPMVFPTTTSKSLVSSWNVSIERTCATSQTQKGFKVWENYNPKVLVNILAIQSKEFPLASSNFHNNLFKVLLK